MHGGSKMMVEEKRVVGWGFVCGLFRTSKMT